MSGVTPLFWPVCAPTAFTAASTVQAVRSSLAYTLHVRVCVQAVARQQKFEQSAGGRAAMKAVREVQQERQATASRPAGGKDTAADWLT